MWKPSLVRTFSCFFFLFVVWPCHFVVGDLELFSSQNRNNYVYIPNNPHNPAPLFVMMHGCLQDPIDFFNGTNLGSMAEERGFYLLFPQQTSSANIQRCWNWFDVSNQQRDLGESKLVIDILNEFRSNYKFEFPSPNFNFRLSSIDSNRIFVAGLSAGAAQSVNLQATYPDIFSGLVVGAGLEFKAAEGILGATTAMLSGGPDPVQQGKLAYQAGQSHRNPPKVMIVHGTNDNVVNPINGLQTTQQWISTLQEYNLDISFSPSRNISAQVTGGREYEIYEYFDSTSNVVRVKYVRVIGMSHAWSGGSSSGTYIDQEGPNVSEMMVDWFLDGSSSSSGVLMKPLTALFLSLIVLVMCKVYF